MIIKYISFNGTIIESSKECISINEGFLYGYGLFETIKVYNNKMFFLEEHMDRLIKGCKILNIEFNISLNIIEKYCYELLKINNLNNGGIRIACTKNGSEFDLIITTRNSIYNKDNYDEGFKLCFAETKRNPNSLLVSIKSNNYLENIITLQKAKETGYNEAIFLNTNDKISEGCISNIFFIKDDILYTPSENCGILLGIVREKVIQIIKGLDHKLQVGEFSKEQLITADEIFITNSLMDIMPVRELANIRFDLGNNRITKILINKLKELYN